MAQGVAVGTAASEGPNFCDREKITKHLQVTVGLNAAANKCNATGIRIGQSFGRYGAGAGGADRCDSVAVHHRHRQAGLAVEQYNGRVDAVEAAIRIAWVDNQRFDRE